jgi:adenylate cyclase
MDERERLVERLRQSDVPTKAIEKAEHEGRLPALAVETALGDGSRHSLTALAQNARLQPQTARMVLQALGRPDPGRGQRPYTDEDIELARIAKSMLDAGLPKNELTEVARVIGLAMSQSAEAVRRMVGDALLEPGVSEERLGLRYTDAVEALGPLIPALFTLTFRAHLRDGVSRELITEAERNAGRLSETQDVVVAFADMVGYSRLGDALPPEELGGVAGRFAQLAAQVTKAPVRLVKMIGDAAMFVSPDAKATIKVLNDLRDAVHAAEPPLPQLRVGVAYGPATPRAGDWFGSTVNLASRITEAAAPGQLLATEEVVERDGGQSWKKRRKRSLKGIEGRVRLCSDERNI